MPELPDLTIYIESLQQRIVNQPLERIRITSPFLLRTVDPPLRTVHHTTVLALGRIGKQIILELEEELFLIIHLMIAGRLHWKKLGAKVCGKIVLAGFDFPTGTLLFTEASSKKRASLCLVRGRQALSGFDRGGLEILDASLEKFQKALRRENHTLKRSLTDPGIFSGIGNAYSDEILHAARLSPLRLSRDVTGEEILRLYNATNRTLREWIDRLRRQTGASFPEKVTAFHPGMAVHGKYGKACPVCRTSIQRIVYAENECNYCPRCQTKGKILADRSLSRLLKDDWPKTIEDLESTPGFAPAFGNTGGTGSG